MKGVAKIKGKDQNGGVEEPAIKYIVGILGFFSNFLVY